MTTKDDPKKLAEEGKRAFEARQYEAAAQAFRQAAEGYASQKDALNAAEMHNNLSVALLKAGKAQAALEAAAGTEQVFASSGDVKRQAMSLGNQAAALEALKRVDEAIAAYERSAELFGQAGERDLRSMVLKSAAALKLKRGKVSESAMEMLDSLGSVKKPTLLQRLLKLVLRLKP